MKNIQLIMSLFILSVSFADDYVLEWASPNGFLFHGKPSANQNLSRNYFCDADLSENCSDLISHGNDSLYVFHIILMK